MKTYAPIALLLAGIAAASGAFAANPVSVTTQIERCFQAHAYLMRGSARGNVKGCWQMHKELMRHR